MMKIIAILKSILILIKENYQSCLVSNNPLLMVKALQKAGIDIADDVVICHPKSFSIDITRPSLIEIGSGTSMNKNFTVLTHDFASRTFLHKYGEFIPSSGKVRIGKHVWFGQNVTVLKGSDIGDNCIIGLGSTVMSKIPANSVAVGCPAKVICTIDQYFEKRKKECMEEAFEYARSIQEKFHRRPIPSDFWEEFPLFVSGNQIAQHPEIPIKKQLGTAYENWKNTHKATFASFDDFLLAAGLKQ